MRWEVHNFEDVVFLQEGPGIRKYEYEEGGYPMINVRCVQDGYVDMSKSRSANRELAEGKWKHFQIDAGDILFTISGTIGRAAIVKPSDLPLLMNTSVVRFKSKVPALSPSFLYHYVRSSYFVLRLQGMATGTAIKNVGPSHLKKMSVPIPPLEEQERIVEVLDEAFAAIDRAKANIERNLTNARELFQSHLSDIFSDASEKWDSFNLEAVLDMYQPKTIAQKEMAEDGKYPVFGANGQIGWHNEFNHEEPEVLLTCRGATCGFLNWSLPNSWINGNAMVMRPKDSSQLSQEFLFKALEGGVDTTKAITGSAQPQITRKSLNPLCIPIPPLEEQERIVRELDSLKEERKGLEVRYQAAFDNLKELRQSILEQAFEGKLTEPVAA